MSTRTKLFRLWSLAAIVAMLVALVPVGVSFQSASAQTTGPEVALNEIVVSTSGTDTEFVELAGSAGTSLTDVYLLEVVSGGEIDTVLDLSAGAIPADGYWVATSPEAESVLGVTGDSTFPDNTFTNNSQTYLLVYQFSGTSGADIDIDDDGTIDSPFWNAILDDVALIEGDSPIIYSTNVIGPDGTFLAPGAYRCPNSAGAWNMHSFSDFSGYSPGAANECGTTEPTATPTMEPTEEPTATPTAEPTEEPSGPPAVNLSEIRIDQPSTDNDEYFELAGDPGTSLAGLTYLVIGDGVGGSGVIENVTDLSSSSIPSSGFFVAAEGSFTFGSADLTTSLDFENSDNVTHMLVWEFSGSDGDDLDTDDDGTLDVEPWTSVVDSVSLIETVGTGDQIYSPVTVGPDGSFVPGHVFLCDDGWRIGSFGGGEDTPGSSNACVTTPPEVAINEIRIDQPSTDNDEYFELAGDPGTSLAGLTYLVIGDGFGGSGVIENVTDLGSSSIPSSGFFVAAEGTFSFGSADLTTSLNFENSDNVTHLLVWQFSGSDGDDLDTDDDGVLDSEPWASVVDSVSLIESIGSGDQVYGLASVGPDGSFVPGHAFLCEDGWRIGSFGGGDDTPGAANVCPTGPEFGTCGMPATFIHDVQGSGFSSPLEGQAVVIEGVVVADFSPGLSGFFLQEESAEADNDPATSEGIFIEEAGLPVSVGDVVRLLGTVEEGFGRTQLTGVTEDEICGTSPLPVPVELSLPMSNFGDFEPYEGMYVIFPQDLTISEFFNFDRFGEIVLTAGRQFQPTALEAPGPAADAILEANLLGRITLDDGRSSQNPDPAIHPNGSEFTLTNRFRGGDLVANVIGVMDYAFGLYRIQPTSGADYLAVNPRPLGAPEVGGDLQIASFNVLNFFTTLDDGVNDICGPLANQECRGADNAEELQRQRAKIVAALAELNADVVGLIEIQNDGNDASVADLVAGLNDELGAGTYDYIATGFIGSDAIKQAFIYKPASVSPAGAHAVLDTPAFVDPLGYGDDKSRPALSQTFVSNATGGMVTVSVNHLKSKGSPCGPGDDGDLVGSCNLTRTLAAEELIAWLASGPTGYPEVPVMIIGDLNSYDKEDPIDALKDGGYEDLLYDYQGELAYSYVFDGQLGYLDYAMAGSDLVDKITGAAAWHINADEPDILDYDTSFKQDAQDAIYAPNEFRSSDHDAVVSGVEFGEITPTSVELLQALLEYYESKGFITGNNTTKVLMNHLENAADYLADGKQSAYEAQIQAFINQIQGKAPRFVAQSVADGLASLAGTILSD